METRDLAELVRHLDPIELAGFIDGLSPEDVIALSDDLRHPMSRLGPLWTPQPKQELASEVAASADETLYGGAAGGGKTEWLINYVGEQMEAHPHNRGVIFRRVYPSLARTIQPRARAIFYDRARWNGNEHTFTWPNGSVLQLASLQYADTVLDHQGAEYGVVAFEEITEFLEKQYEFILGRLRAPADGIRPHAIGTTNPGGPGHRWVKRRWVRPHEIDLPDDADMPRPLQVWTPAPTSERPKPLSRAFVPATIADNPALLRRDPDYLERLRGAISNRGLRRALELGDWDAIDAVEGALWEQAWLDAGRLKQVRPTDVARRLVAIDPSDGDEAAGSDEYGVAAGCVLLDGSAAVEHSAGWFGSPRDLAKRTVEMYHDLRADGIVIEKNHGGKWLPEVLRGVDPNVNVILTWASEGKRMRAEPVAALFEPDKDHRLRYRARLVGYHPELEAELTTFTGAVGEPSPNRLDAAVWLLHELMIRPQAVTMSTRRDERLRGRR